ncbi:PTS mannitol transporter subunit IICBA [Petrocella sp. FN5]|uniref:PTS mannitol transporter subunit IICBA n=1 Tax=Petrocella sp. FN5 TaxID=3032002 RepID=UPI0023DC6C31|nr:PTS mannitol transporter subunit IICBA [Petrocella sp. FN5]MDF1617277.1 PTS mannitol transporter subunit IICBA [Petrocella sp. FN5]
MKTITNDNTSAQGLQKFGRFLSGMVMPNIGAFIAWGLITALFIPTGWLPNENLATLVGPMIVYLLPLLIGYTGGKMVYGTRGGVLGAVATMGVVVGTSIPMFIGGMIMGPIAGYLMKKFDESVDGKVPTGFEMLVNNFSAGILGTLLTLLAYVGIGPVVEGISNTFGSGVEAFVNAGLLPLASIFIEPAKILFLNNAINHGVLSPLGIEQAATAGKSIFFLLETNPGPGLGILLAYWVFAKGMIKQSAPGAIIIHFFGGIHEIYFPYILMQPSLLLAVIAGGASGVFTFVITGAGLVAVPSPGSIFALSAMAPRGGLILVLAGVVVSTAVTFLVAAVLINKKGEQEEALTKAKENVSQMKNTSKTQMVNKIDEDLDLSQVKTIAVACDAGMGSSAMGASKLKAALKDAKVNLEVINCSIDQLDDQSDLVITHEKLTKRASGVVPGAIHISISDFINTDIYDRLAERLAVLHSSSVDAIESEDVYQPLKKQNIRIGLPSSSKEEAIRMAGQILFEGGYVEEGYIDAMVQRDSELSTYIGNGTAIPHGVSDAKKKIIKTGISILQFPEGVDFSGNTVYLVVGIAGVGNEHLMILSNLAEIVEDEEKIKQLSQTTDIDYIYKQFTN